MDSVPLQDLAPEVVASFTEFLRHFANDDPDNDEPTPGFEGAAAPKEYREQAQAMKENERTTLFVDFQHVQAYDIDLADAIKAEFHYLEPHLRQSVAQLMADLHEGYAQDRDFHVSFFNLPHLCAIRELRTDKIATCAPRPPRRLPPTPRHTHPTRAASPLLLLLTRASALRVCPARFAQADVVYRDGDADL